MNSIEQFYEHLDKHPGDWEFRLAFADWLEENGVEDSKGRRCRAEGQRWQVVNKKYPKFNIVMAHQWMWCFANKESVLPYAIPGTLDPDLRWSSYFTQQEADLWLAERLEDMRLKELEVECGAV